MTDSKTQTGPGPSLSRRSFIAWAGALGAAAGASELASPLARAADQPDTLALTAQQEASRFLAQSTFGADLTLINQVASEGMETWLDAQMAIPPTLTLPTVLDLIEQGGEEDSFLFIDWQWWQGAMAGSDLVRQRVAFALSQIFVISRRLDLLFDTASAISAFHDVLLEGAFGNFRDMLLGVALQPSMGFYLSHLNNRRSDPAANRFPDENFAREVMQLFSIGLFKLHPDGSQILDGDGQPIPTYGNAEITEMAKIFTGLTMAPEDGDPVIFGEERETYHLPMVMYEPEHEPGAKTLLDGFLVPAGQTGMQDIESAIDHLFQHPNVGPFIGKSLIRFLVTSNPSPAYVGRVSAAFANNGSGVRGDMKAVIKAILLDPEARDTSKIDDPTFGKVREPLVRWIQLGRAFHATSPSGQFRHFGGAESADEDLETETNTFAQYPFFAPSVFNFFSPNHQPAGALTAADLVAPELEIIHAYTSIATINKLHIATIESDYIYDQEEPIELDLSAEVAIAQSDPAALLDHLDLVLTYGTLSAATRQIILDAILPLSEDAEDQVRLALYLISISPEYGVQR